jgi:hypothetical protein
VNEPATQGRGAGQEGTPQAGRSPLRTPSLPVDRKKLRIILEATQFDLKPVDNGHPGLFYGFRRLFRPYYHLEPPAIRLRLRQRMGGDRMIPAFASLGAVRSGTSLLSDYIMQHPCVVLPLAKELPNWSEEQSAIAGFPTRTEQRKVEKKYGVAVTGYCSPIVPDATFPYFASAIAPAAKMVVILRDPAERSFAHWRWDQQLRQPFQGTALMKNLPDFDEIVRLEIEAYREGATIGFNLSGVEPVGYLRTSIYLPFLKSLFRFYTRESVLLIDARDFFADPAGTAKRVYGFLGLPAYEPVEMPVRNAAPAGTMSDATRQLLTEFFEPLNQKLFSYLGVDFGWR